MRQKHHRENMQRQKLTGQDLSGHDYLECDFRYSDLTGVSLAQCNLYRSDFTGANLANITISLNCFSFAHVKFDDDQIDRMVYLLTLADISDAKREDLIRVLTYRKKERLDKLFGQNI